MIYSRLFSIHCIKCFNSISFTDSKKYRGKFLYNILLSSSLWISSLVVKGINSGIMCQVVDINSNSVFMIYARNAIWCDKKLDFYAKASFFFIQLKCLIQKCLWYALRKSDIVVKKGWWISEYM